MERGFAKMENNSLPAGEKGFSEEINRLSSNESPENDPFSDESPAEVITDESGDERDKSDRSSPYDMAIMTDEATGEQWCTIKYAASLTGLSYSTIRRYTKDGRLEYRTEDSPFGKVNYVRISDIENYKAAYDLDKAKRGVRAGDYQFEMASFIRTAFAPDMSELHNALSGLETAQSELSRSLGKESEDRRQQMDEIKAQNEALMAKIGELSELIAKQDETISELKSSAEKKGFFSRLFGK